MKYILVTPDISVEKICYQDMIAMDDVKEYSTDSQESVTFCSILKKIHTGLRVAACIDMPFKEIYYKDLFGMIEDNTCIIFNHISAGKMGKRILNKIKAYKKNVKIVLLLWDSFDANSPSLFRSWNSVKNVKWDVIFSYDEKDCKKYGFVYMGKNYYSVKKGIIPSCNASDLYFIGRDKKNDTRIELVAKIYKYLKQYNINFNCNIVTNSALSKKHIEEIKIQNQNIPYDCVLADVMSSNCILEVLQRGQEQQTLRYFEAICYNKKLLTNNPKIVNLPFYNERYMKYFSRLEDIDINWLQKKENINYGYNGEFSSAKLIDRIKEIEKSNAW